jgi:hypothetical protein
MEQINDQKIKKDDKSIHKTHYTVPDLPWKEGQGKGERPRVLKELTKQEFGLTWD